MMTLTYFTAISILETGFYMGKVKTKDFLKTVAALDLQTTNGVDEGM